MEVRLEGVFPSVLLHYHPLVFQYGDEVTQSVVTESDTDRGVCFPQSPFKFLVTVFVFQGECRFQCNAVLLFGDVPIRVELPSVPFCLILVLELVVLQQFGLCLPVDAESKWLEVHCPDMCGFDCAYTGVLLVLFYLQHRFRLVA